MKTIVLMLCCLFCFVGMKGQAKQRKELLLQIAALRVYADYAQKGYNTARKGLNFVGDLKKGEVNLHSDYFISLHKVNPKIRNYFKVAEIIALQLKIVKTCQKTIRKVEQHDLFHGSEMDHVKRSFDRLLEHCSDTIDALIVMTKDASIDLKDDQRLERIDKLHLIMLDDYNFCKSFSMEAEVLAVSKAKEKNDAAILNGLYESKK
ncbi:hypothetical protein KHA90_08005 [Flavobacterium psychroterrae]|uniref:TerB family tellurite resistance protein n=1 Tax=Flavobacterium psychroterrae TaxID=2133767 RepID=A0ABS5P9K6_9FLAO|nr:hypothetical protein [Flavobacterium psychroterrae]MBS7230964.1 hypothetical protein [Flavobacterium psychroterrae]